MKTNQLPTTVSTPQWDLFKTNEERLTFIKKRFLQNKTAVSIAKELGISGSKLHTWLKPCRRAAKDRYLQLGFITAENYDATVSSLLECWLLKVTTYLKRNVNFNNPSDEERTAQYALSNKAIDEAHDRYVELRERARSEE